MGKTCLLLVLSVDARSRRETVGKPRAILVQCFGRTQTGFEFGVPEGLINARRCCGRIGVCRQSADAMHELGFAILRRDADRQNLGQAS